MKYLEGKIFIYGEKSNASVGKCWKGSICWCTKSDKPGRTKIKILKGECNWYPKDQHWDSYTPLYVVVLNKNDYPELFL